MKEIAILTVLMMLNVFLFVKIGNFLANSTGKSVFKRIIFLLQPVFFYGLVKLAENMMLLMDFSSSSIESTILWSTIGFVLISAFWGFATQGTYEKTTKSGKKDKRYKNNEFIGGTYSGAYLIFLLIYIVTAIVCYYSVPFIWKRIITNYTESDYLFLSIFVFLEIIVCTVGFVIVKFVSDDELL